MGLRQQMPYIIRAAQEDAQVSNTPRPMSFKNQIADSFHAFSVCIMDYFYNQVSLLKGGITKHKMDKKNIGKRQI